MQIYDRRYFLIFHIISDWHATFLTSLSMYRSSSAAGIALAPHCSQTNVTTTRMANDDDIKPRALANIFFCMKSVRFYIWINNPSCTAELLNRILEHSETDSDCTDNKVFIQSLMCMCRCEVRNWYIFFSFLFVLRLLFAYIRMGWYRW